MTADVSRSCQTCSGAPKFCSSRGPKNYSAIRGVLPTWDRRALTGSRIWPSPRVNSQRRSFCFAVPLVKRMLWLLSRYPPSAAPAQQAGPDAPPPSVPANWPVGCWTGLLPLLRSSAPRPRSKTSFTLDRTMLNAAASLLAETDEPDAPGHQQARWRERSRAALRRRRHARRERREQHSRCLPPARLEAPRDHHATPAARSTTEHQMSGW